MKAKELIQQLQKLVDRNNGEDLDISISMDISTGEEDFDNRNFGDVSEVFEQSWEAFICSVLKSKNYE